MKDFLEVIKSFWGIIGALTVMIPVGNKVFAVKKRGGRKGDADKKIN